MMNPADEEQHWLSVDFTFSLEISSTESAKSSAVCWLLSVAGHVVYR